MIVGTPSAVKRFCQSPPSDSCHSLKPIEWLASNMADGDDQRFFGPIAIDDHVWEAAHKTATNIIPAGELFQPSKQQRIGPNPLKCACQFLQELIAQVRALFVVPDGRFDNFEFSRCQNPKDQDLTFCDRLSVSCCRMRMRAKSASTAFISPRS